ncbi:MAG: hypothetical protein ABIR79_22075 [Candidatus Binatia bacterium]
MRVLLALLYGLATAIPASALTPGGGSSLTDCLAEFGGSPANYPASRPRELKCTDNDPACDDDPTPGICQFRTEVCLNVTDPNLPSCAPRALETYFVENEQPDTNPKHDFDFQTLEDQLNFLVLPLEATDLNVCSGEVQMSVRLPIQPSRTGGRFRRGKKQIESTLAGDVSVRDEDKLKMTCVPGKDTLPCDGVTSTFQQIQRQIFTPTCAIPTCHNVAQGEHQMSLAEGEAYASLVGVTPANFVASGAGLKRVDPGNPDNSFLLKKLQGDLVDGEGAPMPKDLKKLHHINLDLIEEWIAAGAPETGFATAIGCH